VRLQALTYQRPARSIDGLLRAAVRPDLNALASALDIRNVAEQRAALDPHQPDDLRSDTTVT
jgi:hypothetical protein